MIPARQQSPPPGPVSLSKVLLVEGSTPAHFFEALLRELGIDQQIEIRDFSSVNNLHNFLTTLAVTPAFAQIVSALGVVRDAETQPATAARQSVQDAFIAAGLTPNRTPPIRTSVFILPDNLQQGMIETLCMEAVRTEPTLAHIHTCVEEFFDCLARNRIPLPDPRV